MPDSEACSCQQCGTVVIDIRKASVGHTYSKFHVVRITRGPGRGHISLI